MKKITIGINGFGRIGRTLYRLLEPVPYMEVVLVNDLADSRTLAHLLQYDSIHGIPAAGVEALDDGFRMGSARSRLTNFQEPGLIPWGEHGVDLVVEATGRFKSRPDLEGHLRQGARKVLLSSPSDSQDIPMVVYGINDELLDADMDIISCASCTTHNAAPMIRVLDDLCGIEQAYITTVHSYTSDQSLHDRPHRDLRRARAAALSIVPTTTGAAKALTRIFPHLSEVIGGCGIRVPVPNGSLTDITAHVRRPASIAEINATFMEVSQKELKNVLFCTKDPIVSIDINNSCYSCTFDSQMTSVVGNLVKVIGWYDNETGYSSRVRDTIELLIERNFI
ncbi:type I glyceraldehyde-3-phosphate dehydrogenase [Robiginitalea sp. SC105]|uniref:type I glyceraldehyde-3-phosphate dehydrogenase n=1 Tax=Robiginitalea sp. SC105 TaxID=2762332 RepID=UPI0016395380|nr:type I glyceraldehyde-3-phosphate dehydrogenase [Robiginitalea sp. SC105]MBC2839073.1 aldehyde dehydrogenase [Robiginitalea sp. SC105]